jgi:hypothetical protein
MVSYRAMCLFCPILKIKIKSDCSNMTIFLLVYLHSSILYRLSFPLQNSLLLSFRKRSLNLFLIFDLNLHFSQTHSLSSFARFRQQSVAICFSKLASNSPTCPHLAHVTRLTSPRFFTTCCSKLFVLNPHCLHRNSSQSASTTTACLFALCLYFLLELHLSPWSNWTPSVCFLFTWSLRLCWYLVVNVHMVQPNCFDDVEWIFSMCDFRLSLVLAL